MKKILFFGSILFIFVMLIRAFVGSVQTSRYKPVQAQAITTNTEYPTATPQPTFTIVPSATIDYQQTAIVAQSTADEARRINSMATAEYIRLMNEQLAMTQVIEQQNFIIQSWTITAALTTIPLTATQQAIVNTQIPQQQQIIAAQMTATKYAPTQMAVMIDAQNNVKYGEARYLSGIVGPWIVLILVIGLLVFMFRYPMTTKSQPAEEKESSLETVVWVKNTKDNGAKSLRLVVPCTSEQLTELSELAVNGERTFGINKLESTSRTLRSKRDVIYQFREFLINNDFAFPPKPGEIALNDDGIAFLSGWFDTHELPDGYDFPPHSPEKSDIQNHTENPQESIIPMANHTHDDGGGGANPVLAVDSSK